MASESAAKFKDKQSNESESTAAANTTTPILKIFRTYVDTENDTLWIAVKPTPSLSMAKLEESLSNTMVKEEGQKKTDFRRSKQRRSLLGSNTNHSNTEEIEMPCRDSETTDTTEAMMGDDCYSISASSQTIA